MLEKLLRLPPSIASAAQKSRWEAFAALVPPLPMSAGATPALRPCARCPPGTSNSENPELYAVHPYRLLTAARAGNGSAPALAPAARAFAARRNTGDVGWNQNAMDAALLGMAAAARGFVEARAHTAPATGYRFPAFMPAFQDCAPQVDHLAVFSNALTYMLLQQRDDAAQSVVLLPAWPCEWDVDFELHAPLNTTVSGALRGGELTYAVSPPSRAAAVSAAACQRGT